MLLIWVLPGIAAVGVVATYSRTTIGEHPNARSAGSWGARGPPWPTSASRSLSRRIAIVPAVLARARRHLAIGCPRGRRDHPRIALWPGSLDETGIEITPARALATVGAILALGLTLAAWRTNGIGRLGREQIVKRGPTTHEIPVYLTPRGPFPGS